MNNQEQQEFRKRFETLKAIDEQIKEARMMKTATVENYLWTMLAFGAISAIMLAAHFLS